MSHPINDQILENIYEEIQENYLNLSEKDQQQLAYKTMEEQAQ
jgi:DNA-binding cell septation regulator SpoVG